MTESDQRRVVQVLDAFGEWHDAVAVSGVEPTHRGRVKIHDFPVVWVQLVGKSGKAIPWPAEDVRPKRS